MSGPAYVCRQFVEDVTGYLEGTLSEELAARIDAHLADCPHCREYLRQMRRTIADAGALSEREVDAMPPDLRDRLLEAFGEQDV
jgi:predicted anti-sigma-YlaC factor YlaD